MNDNVELIRDEESMEIIESPTAEDAYLSFKMLEKGDLRNIKTVRVKLGTKSFLVDVLKKNTLYTILESDRYRALLDSNNDPDASTFDLASLNIESTNDLLMDYIVSPELTLKGNKLCVFQEDQFKEVPPDIVDLLLEAYKVVNEQENDAVAADSFQSTNGTIS